MAVSLVAYAQGTSGPAPDCAEPAGAQDGDLLVAHVSYFNNDRETTISGWTRVMRVRSTVSCAEVWTKVRSGATGTTTVTFDVNPDFFAMLGIVAFRGASATIGPTSSYVTTADDFAFDIPSVTVAQNGSYVVAAVSGLDPSDLDAAASGLTFTEYAQVSYEGSTFTAPANAGATGVVTISGADHRTDTSNRTAAALFVVSPAASAISGSSAGSSSTSATLRGLGQRTGSSAGSASTSATLRGLGQRTGSSAGSASTTAALTGRGALAGSAAGVATTSASLASNTSLSGSAAGAATCTATLTGRGALAGASAGAATCTGSMGTVGFLTGATAGSSITSATLTARGVLTAAAQGTANCTGALTGLGALAATCDASSSTSASLTVEGANYLMVGSAQGRATCTGTLHSARSITSWTMYTLDGAPTKVSFTAPVQLPADSVRNRILAGKLRTDDPDDYR